LSQLSHSIFGTLKGLGWPPVKQPFPQTKIDWQQIKQHFLHYHQLCSQRYKSRTT
jgi:hypothetical protein